MARVTVEDCIKRIENRFLMCYVAAKRARQLKKGAKPFIDTGNREVVTALREVAEGYVYPVNPVDFEAITSEDYFK